MGTLATLLAFYLLMLGACGQSDDEVCLHYITGEPIAQVRDADGTLWDVKRQPYRPYPSAELSEGCAIPVEARLETGGMPHIIEYQGGDGRVIHSRSVPGTWAHHAKTGEYVAVDGLLPVEALMLVDYRWHRP